MRWKQKLFEIAPYYWAGNILMDEVVAKAIGKTCEDWILRLLIYCKLYCQDDQKQNQQNPELPELKEWCKHSLWAMNCWKHRSWRGGR